MIVVRTEMKCHVQSFRFCYHSFVVIFIEWYLLYLCCM